MSNPTSFTDKWLILGHFIRTRWGLNFRHRRHLEAWQQRQLKYYFEKVLPQAQSHIGHSIKAITDLPYMDKVSMMANFAAHNTANISADEAMGVAISAEESRDFTPSIQHPRLGELTVGMSSGTSGRRGLFLVSRAERFRWAGILLAKTLPTSLLWQILCVWRQALSIAFFLRANSNLYNTLNSRRIDFCFYDLLRGVDIQINKLNRQQPHALVAPATVLRRLAECQLQGDLHIKPLHIISVAEVLEMDDAQLIETAFACKPHQIYQATEGFLAYCCEHGNLHLNETHILIEKEWLDEKRFQPVITDFSRTTQLIARYRLNDILRIADEPCPCGRVETHILAIEGRADQILWLRAQQTQELKPIFPDLLRRAMMMVNPAVHEYNILQRQSEWIIFLPNDHKNKQDQTAQQIAVEMAIKELCDNFQLVAPQLNFSDWQAPVPGTKRRRIVCEEKLQ